MRHPSPWKLNEQCLSPRCLITLDRGAWASCPASQPWRPTSLQVQDISIFFTHSVRECLTDTDARNSQGPACKKRQVTATALQTCLHACQFCASIFPSYSPCRVPVFAFPISRMQCTIPPEYFDGVLRPLALLPRAMGQWGGPPRSALHRRVPVLHIPKPGSAHRRNTRVALSLARL